MKKLITLLLILTSTCFAQKTDIGPYLINLNNKANQSTAHIADTTPHASVTEKARWNISLTNNQPTVSFGKLGINMTPTYPLDVDGDINMDSGHSFRIGQSAVMGMSGGELNFGGYAASRTLALQSSGLKAIVINAYGSSTILSNLIVNGDVLIGGVSITDKLNPIVNLISTNFFTLNPNTVSYVNMTGGTYTISLSETRYLTNRANSIVFQCDYTNSAVIWPTNTVMQWQSGSAPTLKNGRNFIYFDRIRDVDVWKGFAQ